MDAVFALQMTTHAALRDLERGRNMLTHSALLASPTPRLRRIQGLRVGVGVGVGGALVMVIA